MLAYGLFRSLPGLYASKGLRVVGSGLTGNAVL